MMTCMDCGVGYAMIVMIEDEAWRQIAPQDGELCLPCMETRLRAKGLRPKATISYRSDAINAYDRQVMRHATDVIEMKHAHR